MDPLGEVLPRFDAHELHERSVDASPAAALGGVLSAPAAPEAFTRALLSLRGVRQRDGTVEELLRGIGGKEIVRRDDVAVFRRDGRVTIAVAFWAEPLAQGRSLLRTETRVYASDASSRWRFRAYWLVVRPFSGLIRRSWLRAAVR